MEMCAVYAGLTARFKGHRPTYIKYDIYFGSVCLTISVLSVKFGLYGNFKV